MISQVLNRDFVMQQLKSVRADLEQLLMNDREGARPPIADLGVSDYQSTLELIQETEARETKRSSGQTGYDPPPPERRGQEAAPLDDFSFFSRDPIISILQSALEEYLESESFELVESKPPMDDQRRGSRDEIAVTDRGLRGVKVIRKTQGRRLFGAFELADPRWLSVGLALGLRLFRQKHAFNKVPATPMPIGNTARLLLVGDWGTGTPRAQKIATQMRKVLQDGSGVEQHVIHLGDVYYSGWQREYEKRFLQYWPVSSSESDKFVSWALNGNHDMYTGGHAYFDFLLRERRFGKQEQSSFFSLYNDSWEILGVDTAYDDPDTKGGMMDPQREWILSKLHGSKRKVLLLSHHQLFSVYDNTGTTIATALAEALSSNRIRSWFWGHEHRCMLYRPHQGLEYGRCVGHGGVPTYQWHRKNADFPKPWGLYEYRDVIPKGFERWGKFGFVVLDLNKDVIRVRYINEDGEDDDPSAELIQ
jgi:hypothetical protein